MENVSEPPAGPRNGNRSKKIRDSAWRALRRSYHSLPVGEKVRLALKAGFYSIYGRLFPDSPRRQLYLESLQHLRQGTLATRELPPVELEGTGGRSRGYDVMIFPVIDWEYRHQRPQHLASLFAARGHRVVYFRTGFVPEGRWSGPQLRFIEPNVCLASLPCRGAPPVIYSDPLSPDLIECMEKGVEAVREKLGLSSVLAMVDHPFWTPIAERLENARVVYDCMDLHGGFSNTGKSLTDIEYRLISSADLVLTASAPLAAQVAPRARKHLLLRNAAAYDHFCRRPERLALSGERPVVGYYGAIAEWFDAALVETAARALPGCDFVLIGSTVGADLACLEGLPNVRLLGERPFGELPAYLHAFDVCLIPFHLTPLTLSTNPVKIYEYLSAGKPVVATPLPELESLGELVLMAAEPEQFAARVKEALHDRSAEAAERRRAFARKNTWEARGEALFAAVDRLWPKVSVIVLAHNGLDLTVDCLKSLERFTRYPDWELILVDNASSDQTAQYFLQAAFHHRHVRPVINAENLGFAAGNNRGARCAMGEYLVFLNNDTFVTPGWLGDLTAHFLRDPKLGLCCPVTNNIGNEARIEIQYSDMEEMVSRASEYTAVRRSQEIELPSVPFFCAMVPRAVWEEVGELDELFGMGFFEDDDYSRRVQAKGYRTACAEDVFIHHHLSASFSKVDEARRRELFERNRRYYESKWGAWIPHRYRMEPGARTRS